jgi:hypothetical protein
MDITKKIMKPNMTLVLPIKIYWDMIRRLQSENITSGNNSAAFSS